MKNSAAVLIFLIALVSPVFADGPTEEERTSDAHDKMIDNIVNKPQRKLSTVGPVPVGTVAQAPTLPGSGGLNAKELNVLVAPGLNRQNPVRPREGTTQGSVESPTIEVK